MRVLATGAAGFIGFHAARALMARGDAVTGFDVVNDYYDVALKEARLAELDRLAAETGADWRFLRADLADRAAVDAAFDGAGFERVIHLAARAGVRPSLRDPALYQRVNVEGTVNLLEAARSRREAPRGEGENGRTRSGYKLSSITVTPTCACLPRASNAAAPSTNGTVRFTSRAGSSCPRTMRSSSRG